MTDLLEQAFARVSQLPPTEQDQIAGWLLQELESEQRWDMALSKSKHTLSRLANEALAEHAAGKTKLLNPDAL